MFQSHHKVFCVPRLKELTTTEDELNDEVKEKPESGNDVVIFGGQSRCS